MTKNWKKWHAWLNAHSRILVTFFFIFYFFLGLAVIRDYGISWDEPTERFTSFYHYKFAVSKLYSVFGRQSELLGEHMFNRQMLHGYPERYYGTFLHWPLVAIEHFSGFTLDSQEVFLLRHMNTFMYFFVAVVAFFLFLKKRFSSWEVGLLGAVLLILTPRFFAESFYNNKDILFASWYFFSIFCGLWFLKKKNWWRAAVTGVVLGIALNTRILGVVPLGLISLWAAIDIGSGFFSKKIQLRSMLMATSSLLLLIAVTFATYIVSLPTAWGNEIGFIPEVLQHFAHYGWQGRTLYLGELVPWNNIPWHFAPVYLWVTTPIWYSILFVLGVIGFILTGLGIWKKSGGKSYQKFFQSEFWKTDSFVLAAGFLPWLAVVGFHSVIYDSWRHLYFVYFPFLYCGIYGLVYWWQKKRYQKVLLAGTVISLVLTLIWMVFRHPYQFLYFNPMVRPYASQNFERDYWGVSTLDLVEYILKTDDRSKIKIWQHDYLYKSIDLFSNRSEKSRFEFVQNKYAADYATRLFHNTRDTVGEERGFTEVKSIEVDGIRALTLFKRSDESTESASLQPKW